MKSVPPKNSRRDPLPSGDAKSAESPEPPAANERGSRPVTNRPPPKSAAPNDEARPPRSYPRLKKAFNWARVAVGVGIVAAASLGVAWGAKRYMTESPRFAIRTVEVAGNARRTPEEVAELGGLRVGENVFAVDLETARRNIEKDPWIDSATVTRKLPGSVMISITEHEPRALVAIEDQLFLAARDGEIFKEVVPDDPIDLPVVTGIEAKDVARDRKEVEKNVLRALDVIDELEATQIAKRYPVQEVHLPSDGTIEVIVGAEGIAVHLGDPPYRGKLEQAERVFDELAKRKTVPAIVFLDNENSPDRVVVRVR